MGSLVGGALSLAGGLLGQKSSKDAAKAQAQAQVEAARIAADAARFRPVGVTTGFGTSKFTTDAQGNVATAGYELTPQMQAIRDALTAQAGQQGLGFTQQGLEAAQGLFNLGQGYIAQTPEQASQQWLASQQAALAPGREQAMSGLMNRLAQTGTQGLGVAQAGGGAANPLMQAFANAQAQQDLELAARAQEQGRAQTQFGSGLLSGGLGLAAGAYSPLQTQLNAAQGVEQLGQNALDLGTAIGQKVSTASANAGNYLAQGMTGAANALANVNRYSPFGSALSGLSQNRDFTNALGQWGSGLFSPTSIYGTSGMGQTGFGSPEFDASGMML